MDEILKNTNLILSLAIICGMVYLIIEFIPKNDSKVKILLHRRANMFPNYNQQSFESAFSAQFSLVASKPVPGSQRVIYLYKAKKP